MKKLVGSILVVWALLPASGQAASLTTKGGWDNDRMQLSDPTVFNRSLDACSHIGVKPEIQQKLAELMKVPQANVRFEFCRRIMTGYVKGTISYDDYVHFVRDFTMSDSIARALRIDRSALESMRDQKRGDGLFQVTAKMDSGETFQGSTINSKKRGRHFSLQSSRKSTTCYGDSDSPRPMSTFLIKCSDGRTGTAIITVASDNMSAMGTVKLSDGSKGRVTVGHRQKS